MTELKRTQGKQLAEKSRTSKKRASHLLLCGLILGGVVTPLTTVLAEEVGNTAQPTEQVATQASESTEPPAPEVEATTSSIPPAEETTATVEETVQETQEVVTQESSEPVVVEEELSSTPETNSIQTTKDAVETPTASGEESFVLGNGGWWYRADGGTTPMVELNITFRDRDTGAILTTTNWGRQNIDGRIYIGVEGYKLPTDSPYYAGYSLEDAVRILPEHYFNNGAGVMNITVDVYKANETPAPDPELEMGTVTMHWVDQDGNNLDEPYVYNGFVGDPYSVTRFDFEGYTLAENQDANLDGVVAKTNTDVYVRYVKIGETEKPPVDPEEPEAVQARITITALDTNGYIISKTINTDYKVGDTATITAPVIDGYTVQGEDTHIVDVPIPNFEVQFIYAVNEEIKGTVNVRYVDNETGKEIQAPTVFEDVINNRYIIPVPTISGYTFNADASDSLEGTFKDTEQTVTLRYDLDDNRGEESGGVYVVFATGNGEYFSEYEPIELTGKIGDTWALNAEDMPKIDGYELMADQFPMTGTFVKEQTQITVFYDQVTEESKTTTVTISYLDADGKPLSPMVVRTAEKGSDYDYTSLMKNFEGYKFNAEKSGSLTGKVGDSEMNIVLYYDSVDQNNTGDGSGNSNGGSGTGTGNTNNGGATNNGTNTNGSGNNQSNNGNNATGTSNNKKNNAQSSAKSDTLPQTGEADEALLTLSGFGAMALAALAWVFRRKRI